MIPPIWFIELTRIDQANMGRRNNHSIQLQIDSLLKISETSIGNLGDTPIIDEEVKKKMHKNIFFFKVFFSNMLYSHFLFKIKQQQQKKDKRKNENRKYSSWLRDHTVDVGHFG